MTMHHTIAPRRQQGLTLVELMIALTLGLIVIAALVGIFFSSNQNYRQNEALATLQDNARFALDSLSRDLAMAGYWGGVRAVDAGLNVRVSAAASAAVSKTGVDGDCGPATQSASTFFLFDVGTPIVFRNHINNNTSSASVDVDFRCLLPADVQPMTDVVMIRRVSGVPVATTALIPNRFYVKTNLNIASLFRAGTSFNLTSPTDCPDSNGINEVCPPTTSTTKTPVTVYAYTPQIYYVRSYLRVKPTATTAGDGLPVLCHRYLNDSDTTLPNPAMVEDCLAEGVENLQIEWGIGPENVGNYLSNPDTAQLAKARTARIHILVRATNNNVQASKDAKTYNLGDLTNFTPPPGVLRRSFTTTVQLKNLQPS